MVAYGMDSDRPVSDLKREMLRAAVKENVQIIQGEPPAGRSRRKLGRTALRALLVIVVPAALFVGVNAFSGGSGLRSEVLVVSEKGQAPELRGVPAGSLAAPRKIEPNVFRLSAETIVLDPGHGGSDPGAQTPSGLSEKEITLDVALRLRDLLEEAQFKVRMTRETDENRSLRERALLANRERGDLFVSIHVNSLPMTDRRGVETFYLGPSDDPHVNRLAGAENLDSGYSLADYRKLLEGVYVDVRQNESKQFANRVQQSLLASLRKIHPELKDRGVKSAPFVVLVASEMPGILAEVAAISNAEEARNLADPGYRQAIAKALFLGVTSYNEAKREKGQT